MLDQLHPIAAAAGISHVAAAAGNNGLLTAYNSFMALLPAGLTTLMGIVGIGLIIWVTGRWLWRHRHGSQGGVVKGAPVLGWTIGAALCAPAWLIPIFLTIFGGLFSIVLNLIAGFFGSVGG